MRGELSHHLRMRVRGKAEAAVFLGDAHAEEALVLDELPDLRWQILVDVRCFPIADHRTELVDLAREKALFFGRELRGGHGQELRPIRSAGEKLGIPPDGTGL